MLWRRWRQCRLSRHSRQWRPSKTLQNSPNWEITTLFFCRRNNGKFWKVFQLRHCLHGFQRFHRLQSLESLQSQKRSPPKRTPEIQRDRSYRTLKAFLPAYCAISPSSSSILRSWLYFASLSERLIEPVLISPVSRATTRSAIVQSSVSPDL